MYGHPPIVANKHVPEAINDGDNAFFGQGIFTTFSLELHCELLKPTCKISESVLPQTGGSGVEAMSLEFFTLRNSQLARPPKKAKNTLRNWEAD